MTPLLTLLFGCLSSCSPPETPPAKVLLIGVDGLDPRVVGPMLDAGELPNLAALAARGQAGALDTTQPTISPIIWTTIATGMNRSRHGIPGFRVRDGSHRLVTSSDRKVPALWNMADHHGRRAAVYGWWVTWPAEPLTHGRMVAPVTTVGPDRVRTDDSIAKGSYTLDTPHQVHPEALAPALAKSIEAVEPNLDALSMALKLSPPAGPVEARLEQASRWSVRADAVTVEVALQDLASQPWDLGMVYVSGPDVIGHRYWRYREPDAFRTPPSDAAIAAHGDAIAATIRHTDAQIGRLLALIDDHTTVWVVSDHGMEAEYPKRSFLPTDASAVLISAGHHKAPDGVVFVAGPGVAHQAPSWERPIAHILDVAPTIQAQLQLPVGDDQPGRVIGGFGVNSPARVPTATPEDWQPMPPMSLPDEATRLEQLKALGYMADDGPLGD